MSDRGTCAMTNHPLESDVWVAQGCRWVNLSRALRESIVDCGGVALVVASAMRNPPNACAACVAG